MSDRVPLNEAAVARRARLAAENPGNGEETTAGAPPLPQRVRKPFGTQEQKLTWPNKPGFHRHWFNDEPGRLMRAQQAGYDHVKDEAGKPVATVVGVARGGHALTAYLMEIPLQWYQEDMAAQDGVVHELMGQIGRGEYQRPTGRDGSLHYAGSHTKGDIRISEGAGGRR
jgi:hypothetical protein